ncbi:MAG: hypothetical protein LBJ70_05230 [Holosporales bacterium]|nr:hypothetical protein [Holosporales bacterium]
MEPQKRFLEGGGEPPPSVACGSSSFLWFWKNLGEGWIDRKDCFSSSYEVNGFLSQERGCSLDEPNSKEEPLMTSLCKERGPSPRKMM